MLEKRIADSCCFAGLSQASAVLAVTPDSNATVLRVATSGPWTGRQPSGHTKNTTHPSVLRSRTSPAIGLLLLSMLVAVGLAGPRSARAQIVLGGGVQSYGPDSLRIEANGVIIPSAGGSAAWWYFDWGDGTRNTGYFPQFHHYSGPGDYEIRLVGYDDLGQSEEATFPHHAPEPPATDVAQVVLARTFAGMKEGDGITVMISAYDAAGAYLPLDGRTVEIYAPVPNVMDVVVEQGSLAITALTLPGWDTGAAWVYVYVDRVECQRPLFVIVNRNTGTFTGVEGTHSAFYLPDWYFEQSYVPVNDWTRVMDLAYEEFAWSVNHDTDIEGSPQVQSVSYSPAVHGANGNPLTIGDSAGPMAGVPRFDILFHEMGHNFHSRRMLFLSSGIMSGALYQETVAEWHVQFGCHRLLDLHAAELSLPAQASLRSIRDDNRAYHLWEYQNYVNGGMVFDFGSIMPSHVLVHKIYELCDMHGWDRLRVFYDYFDQSNMEALSSAYGAFGGASDVYRLSALVAVLGLTFGEDLRQVFRPLNFPIDDAFHDAVWQALSVAQADFDGDGDIDIADFAVFDTCLSGPNNPPAGACPEGVNADLDDDGDVDLADFAVFGQYFAR